MSIKYTVTVTSVGTSFVIVVPKPVINGFNLKKGQKLDMYIKDDGIYIPLKEPRTSTIRESGITNERT